MSEHRSHRRPCSSTVFFFSFVVVVAIWSSVGVQRTWTTSGRSDKKYCYFFFVQSFGIVRINPKPNPNRCCTWCSKNRNTVLLSLASSSSSSGADASSSTNNNSSIYIHIYTYIPPLLTNVQYDYRYVIKHVKPRRVISRQQRP